MKAKGNLLIGITSFTLQFLLFLLFYILNLIFTIITFGRKQIQTKLNRKFLRVFSKIIIFRHVKKIYIENKEKILDISKPFILAGIYKEPIDWFILLAEIPEDIIIVTDEFLSKYPYSPITKRANLLFITEENNFVKSKKVMKIIELLNKKIPIAMFINKVYSKPIFNLVKNGAFYLSTKTNVPLLPFIIIKKLGKCTYSYGNIIYPSDKKDEKNIMDLKAKFLDHYKQTEDNLTLKF